MQKRAAASITCVHSPQAGMWDVWVCGCVVCGNTHELLRFAIGCQHCNCSCCFQKIVIPIRHLAILPQQRRLQRAPHHNSRRRTDETQTPHQQKRQHTGDAKVDRMLPVQSTTCVQSLSRILGEPWGTGDAEVERVLPLGAATPQPKLSKACEQSQLKVSSSAAYQ